jgi:heptosyltransferase I
VKILAVRVGRAGDVVMVTPALRALLKNYPDAELHVLTAPDGKRILNGFDPRLTRLHIYDRKKLNAFMMRREIRKQIMQEGYDQIYSFELHPGYLKFWHGVQAEVFQITQEEQHLNYSLRCLNVVRKGADRNIDNEWVNLPVQETGRAMAEAMLVEAGITAENFVVAMHPSFSGLRKASFRSKKAHYLRQWPVESFGRLAQLLTEYASQAGLQLKIIMDLLPDERELGEAIVQASNHSVTLLTPVPNFERYKAVLQRANLLVTPNTGPMHIGGAVGTNMVALFSGLSPDDCGPYVSADQYTALRAEDTDKAELGIAAITPGSVFEACKNFLPAA